MKKYVLNVIFLIIPLLTLASTTVNAGTITLYTDRAVWLADAAAAGLTVTTDDFSQQPPNYPNISDVGGSNWTLDIREGVPWDAGSGRLGYTTGGGRTLSLDYTGGAGQVFGFGIDLGPTVGLLRTSDTDGDALADGGGSPTPHFLGLLGTAVFAPANGPLSGAHEIGTSGLAPDVYFDNLSVATANVSAVPIPAAAWLLGTALIGLLGVGQRRSSIAT